MIHYRSVATLSADVFKWSQDLPRDIEVVVAIPRSGMLVASLLALYRDIPVTDIEGLLEGRIIQTGPRYHGDSTATLLAAGRRVLVVDDSVLFGTQMGVARGRIRDARLPHKVLYGAVYTCPGTENAVDFSYQSVPKPRLFEWNIFHRGELSAICVDLDGVLCRDPTPEENDDGRIYEEFIRKVRPIVVPTRRIGWVVTCRLEKYRALTEEWLSANNIMYNELVMMNFPDKGSRIKAKCYVNFKTKHYTRTGALLFIESSLPQAVGIANLSGKDVLCTESRELIRPGFARRHGRRLSLFSTLLTRNPCGALRLVGRRCFGSRRNG